MVTTYKPKHSHIKRARASDPDLYYKITMFTLFGYDTKHIAVLTNHTPPQTIARNFKTIRQKLAHNENYRVEVYNRFYHVDKHTGDIYGRWRDVLRSLQAPKDSKPTEEKTDRMERLVDCLKHCPMGLPPQKFIEDDMLRVGYNLSAEFPKNEQTKAFIFEPRRYPYPMHVPILRNIEAGNAYFKKKKECRSCGLCKKDKETILNIFADSPYVYIDIKYHLSRFQPREIEDYHDHLFFAWATGCMRGIHHMKSNLTETKGLSQQEALLTANTLVMDFVDITYDAIAGKLTPSLPVPD